MNSHLYPKIIETQKLSILTLLLTYCVIVDLMWFSFAPGVVDQPSLSVSNKK